MSAETINVTLPAEIVRAIREEVDNGAYASADEVIEEALRQWQEGDAEPPEVTAYMRRKIKEALEDPRPSVPIEEAIERLKRRHAERIKANDDEV
jgi:antitoxin ParD1/3/4